MNHLRLVSLFALMSVLGACGGTQYIAPSGPMFTQTNLRFDVKRGLISSVNYQNQELLPVCSQVEVESVSEREIRLMVRDTGRQLRYTLHRSTRLPIETHLNRVVGRTCPDTTRLSSAEQEAIKSGELTDGLSKDAVLLAAGTPPEHKTPSLEGNAWRFWRSKTSTFEVKFVDGLSVLEKEPVPDPVVVEAPLATDVFTLTNLRVARNGDIESVNYQSLALLPLCTKVKITDEDDDEIEFRVEATGLEYRYVRHERVLSPMKIHRERVFGESCADLSSLSPIDKAGIDQAEVTKGMSKEGVIRALGYPSEHATPSTANPTWRYWKSRMKHFDVMFRDGTVSEVK